jgi:tRNA 2-thiouridine synthesizing protein A
MSNMTVSQTDMHFDQALDAKGLNCPLPVLKAKLILNKMKSGEILRVEATDPHSTIDFEAYCARTGHVIISSENLHGIITIYIERNARPGND